MGFDTEDNNRGYKMFDEEYLEWDNATQKCQALGARLPVLSDAATIKIVKKYLDTADFDVFEVRSFISLTFLHHIVAAMGQIQQKGVARSPVQLGHWPHMGGRTEDRGVSGLQQTLCLGEPEAAITRGEKMFGVILKSIITISLGQLC